MEQRSSGLQQGNNLLTQRSYVANAKAITCFSYIPTLLTNALPGTQWVRDIETWQQALAQQRNSSPVLSNNFSPLKGLCAH